MQVLVSYRPKKSKDLRPWSITAATASRGRIISACPHVPIFFRRLLTASGPGVGAATSERCGRNVCCFSHMVGGREGFTLLSGVTHKGQLGQWRGGYRPLQSDSANGLPGNKAPAILHFCRFLLSACMRVLGSRLLMVRREVEKRNAR